MGKEHSKVGLGSSVDRRKFAVAARPAFTLIELLVVIAIIGILAALVVTQLGAARVKARNSSAKSDVTEAGKAIEVFKNDDANSASKVIAPWGTATTAGIASINYNASTVTGGFTSIFTGTSSVAGFTYGLDINNSVGANQTYTYTTHAQSGNAGAATLVPGATNYGNYVFQTSLDTADASSTAYFWVYNGTSAAGAVGSIPAP